LKKPSVGLILKRLCHQYVLYFGIIKNPVEFFITSSKLNDKNQGAVRKPLVKFNIDVNK
jgi:hypothetical protein